MTRTITALVLFVLFPSFAFAGDFEAGVAALENQEFDKAIAKLSACIRENPKNAKAYGARGIAYRRNGDYDKAIEDYSKAMRLDQKDSLAFSNLAWLLSTCPKDDIRDGKKAVELAIKACELSEWKNYIEMSSLANSYAECANFKEAIKWQKKAIEIGLEGTEWMEMARQRLKLYEEGKPYRE